MGQKDREVILLSLISFLVVLGVLVLVHEFGHFIVAKRLGVRVEKFSFGFGPKLFSVKKGKTEYLISAIPLGGYVKMSGEDPSEPLKNERWEFLTRTAGDRFKIILAGPLLNYVLAFLIFSMIFMFGSPVMTTEVGSLLKGHPAEAQGIMVGDKVLAIDGTNVKYWEEMTAIIYPHSEKPIRFLIARDGKTLEKNVTPVVRKTKDIFGKETTIALVGIAPSQKIETVRYGFITSLKMGFNKLAHLTAITYKALWFMITGKMSFKESMTGPIGIFVITGQAAKLGLIYILNLMGILSASLAIFNLLPFPVLDGGHILFLLLEKIMGKPLSLKTQGAIMNVGVSLLILLTIFIFYNDIMKFDIINKVTGLFKR